MRLWIANLVFLLLVPGTFLVYVPLRLVRGRTPAGGLLGGAGGILLAAGAVLLVACIGQFGTSGRGTPAPIRPPVRLVVRGPYRFVRNPMYVGAIAMLLGWAALFRAPALVLYALVYAACVHAFVVGYEEPNLRRRFGAEYDAYRSRVHRWLPRRSPWHD